MKKVKIKTEKDLENLPEDEVVEVESCAIEFKLILSHNNFIKVRQ